jgi:hypothetical protein
MGSSAPKKRRMVTLFVQVTLIALSLPIFFFFFATPNIIPNLANSFFFLGLSLLIAALLLETIAYEKTSVGTSLLEQKPNLAALDRQPHEPTPQALKLHEALQQRGIPNDLEHNDGHKHVDIRIPQARLNLEIDGEYHLLTPEHLFRDLQRDSCSHRNGIDTIRIPNRVVDWQLEALADSIAAVAKKRAN